MSCAPSKPCIWKSPIRALNLSYALPVKESKNGIYNSPRVVEIEAVFPGDIFLIDFTKTLAYRPLGEIFSGLSGENQPTKFYILPASILKPNDKSEETAARWIQQKLVRENFSGDTLDKIIPALQRGDNGLFIDHHLKRHFAIILKIPDPKENVQDFLADLSGLEAGQLKKPRFSSTEMQNFILVARIAQIIAARDEIKPLSGETVGLLQSPRAQTIGLQKAAHYYVSQGGKPAVVEAYRSAYAVQCFRRGVPPKEYLGWIGEAGLEANSLHLSETVFLSGQEEQTPSEQARHEIARIYRLAPESITIPAHVLMRGVLAEYESHKAAQSQHSSELGEIYDTKLRDPNAHPDAEVNLMHGTLQEDIRFHFRRLVLGETLKGLHALVRPSLWNVLSPQQPGAALARVDRLLNPGP